MENSPKKNVDIKPAVIAEKETKKEKIALYFPLFYFYLQIYLKYPPTPTHKKPPDRPPIVAPIITIIYTIAGTGI